MKRQIINLLFVSILIGLCHSAMSQTYNFLKYSKKNGLVSSQTTSLVQDSKGYLWIGTKLGLSRYDGNSFVNYDKFSGLSQNEIESILIDENDILYIGHPNKKITKIAENYQFSVIDKLPDVKFIGKSPNSIKCEIQDKNTIKVTYGEGKEKKLLSISSRNGLVKDQLNDALVDRENILWVATKSNGLMGLPLQNFPIYGWNGSELIHCYRQNNDVNLLTFKNNIIRMSYSNGKPIFTNIFTSKNKNINCGMIQFGSELFYGTNNGMYLYFKETATEYSFRELANKKVTSIEKIGDGDLIIIANNRIYLYLVYTNEIKIFRGFKDFYANSISKIGKETYLLGKGNVFKLRGKKFEPLLNTHKVSKKQNFVHISKGENGNLWLSSSTEGIFSYYPDKDSLVNFSTEKNIPYKSVKSTAQNGNILWISTTNGMIEYNMKKKAYSFFGEKYFNNVSFLPFVIKKKDKVYFSTNKGVAETYDPKAFKTTTNILKIVEFLVSGRKVELDTLVDIEHNSFPIEISYQSISLKDKIYYQYLLEGKDKKWSTPTLNTSVIYSDLNAGDYTFKIRTFDPINEITLNTDEKRFKILVPYWKTAAFVYTLIGIIAFLVIAFYLYRVWRLQKQKEKLELMVNEKTYVLSAQNQNIEQFSYSLSHDLKNPINNIKGLVEIMGDAEERNKPEILDLLMSSAQLLEEKIKSTLNTIKQMQANKKNVEELSFEAIFEDVKKSLLILIKESNVKFKTNFQVKTIHYNSSILESIFYNLVSNSIKYSFDNKQTVINISSKQEGDLVVLTFEDNGIGFDTKKDLDKVFSIFERVDDDKATGSGIGLYMVKQMIELNGGNISVQSQVGKGTTFTIRLREM